jgi:hypothetical protein
MHRTNVRAAEGRGISIEVAGIGREQLVPRIETFILHPSSPEISTCAKWRVEAFADVIQTDIEAEQRSLEAFTSDQTVQVALVAKSDGVLAGTCLLVRSELEPCHPVSPCGTLRCFGISSPGSRKSSC